MIASATINGVAIEINGAPEECYEFFKSHAIYESYKKSPKWYESPREKVCDPLARHYGNCGAKDCQIINPFSRQVSDDGENWIEWPYWLYRPLEDYRFNRVWKRVK